MDVDEVRAGVGELARLLRADGADLHLVAADPARDLIELRLEVEGAECAECILPPPQLEQVVLDALRRRVPTEFELVLHDPRIAGG